MASICCFATGEHTFDCPNRQDRRQALLDQRLANQLDCEQQQRESVRPIGPRPWQSRPPSPVGSQLDLSGEPCVLPTGQPDPLPVVRGQQLGFPVTVARSYRSKAWGGTVVEAPLALDQEKEPPDLTPDDHNRPAYLGPTGPHHCPDVTVCPQRWLTDDEMEDG